MSDKNDKMQKYTGDTITEEQFNELVQTMNVGILTSTQRSSFLWHYAKNLKLDPLTKPFDLIPGQSGKLIIYANRACSDQLRKIHNLTITEVSSGPLQLGDETRKDVWVTKVRVSSPDGRSEDHVGAVGIDGLTGEALSNAIMKCSTKASRRGTIAFCGLGMLDETEVSSIPSVQVQPQDPAASPASVQPKLLDSKPLPAAKPPVNL
jgi:hypothetical protein